MGSIFGYIDMAREESRDENVVRYLSKVMTAIDRARGLTGQLLTFSKGGAPVLKAARMAPFLTETVRFALSGSAVSCRFHLAEDLWPCSIDAGQIGQAIDNIVINALQAIPGGGAIDVTAVNLPRGGAPHPGLPDGDYVKISIRDYGVGIPAEIMPRIFDPFFTTKMLGHGLGLSTCYSIVKRHGGAIEAESQPGKGSTFHVYLPASAAPSGTTTHAPAAKHAGHGTVLVMDDEQEMRDTIGDMLASLGYTVVLKQNGADAVAFFRQQADARQPPAAIILDLTVPGAMGGKEAVAMIRELDRTVPVFVTSGYADDPVMAHPEQYGFTASISKPFRISELAQMLEKHLGNPPVDNDGMTRRPRR